MTSTPEELAIIAAQDRVHALIEHLSALNAANAEREQALAGYGRKIPPDRVTAVRNSLLTDFLLGGMDGSAPAYAVAEFPRLAFEIHVQEVFAQQLDALLGEASRARLTDGIQVAGLPVSGGQRPRIVLPGRG
jgi:hypothetical protein